MTTHPTFRRAYVPRACPAGLGSTTTPGELEAAIGAVVEAWNAAIPRNRVRIVTQVRYLDLRAALAVFIADEIVAAIKFYGRQAWNRSRNAWQTFDHWIDLANLTSWVERAVEHADRVAAAEATRAAQVQPPPPPRPAKREDDDDWRRFQALPPARRQELMRQAAGWYAARGIHRPSQWTLTMCAIAILKGSVDPDERPTLPLPANVIEDGQDDDGLQDQAV